MPIGQEWWQRDRGERECVPYGRGLALIQPAVGEHLGVQIEVGIVNGRPGCVAINGGSGTFLTGTLLRNLPLRQLVPEIVRDFSVRVIRLDGEVIGEMYVVAKGPGFGDAYRQFTTDVDEELASKRIRRTLSDEFLAEVADVYRDAIAQRVSTQKEVQRRLGPTSATNARRWIAEARKRGRLGPAPVRRKGGELQTTDEGGESIG
jgi:hypothetical protein